MNDDQIIRNLIIFLKENNTGLSEEEITSTYYDYQSFKNKISSITNHDIDDFLSNQFGNEWIYSDDEFKEEIFSDINKTVRVCKSAIKEFQNKTGTDSECLAISRHQSQENIDFKTSLTLPVVKIKIFAILAINKWVA